MFMVALIVNGDSVFGSCFAMQYFVSFIVLQSSHRGDEIWLLDFYCLLDAMLLLLLFAFSSRCNGSVCGV